MGRARTRDDCLSDGRIKRGMIWSRPERVAHPTRFERVAFAFGGRRSIQLSYGCLLLTQCLRGFRVLANPHAQPSQAIAVQYSFFLTFRTSWLDTCLRRARLE